MLFKLVFNHLQDKTEKGMTERSFDKEIVSIGRNEPSDIRLPDQRRLVSGRHAEIRQRDNVSVIADVGSKNGTTLNGERLNLGKEYPLKDKDRIIIGDFEIHFHYITTKPEIGTVRKKVTSDPLVTYLSEQVCDVVERLKQVYFDNIDEDMNKRKETLVSELRKAVEGVDTEKAKYMIDMVECHFPMSTFHQDKVLHKAASRIIECRSDEYELYREAYKDLLMIAGYYFDNAEEGLKTQDAVKRLSERIASVLKVMMGSLTDAIRGRRQFEEEFDVEATRIFSWKPNPIKLAENQKEMGKYLLNWNKAGDDIEKAAANLEGVFADIAIHQLGLIAGFKECLRGILGQLDPSSLEEEGRANAVNLGPFVTIAAWNIFKEKHRKLLQEEVRTFETILGPHFAKGYLSIQEKKKVS